MHKWEVIVPVIVRVSQLLLILIVPDDLITALTSRGLTQIMQQPYKLRIS